MPVVPPREEVQAVRSEHPRRGWVISTRASEVEGGASARRWNVSTSRNIPTLRSKRPGNDFLPQTVSLHKAETGGIAAEKSP